MTIYKKDSIINDNLQIYNKDIMLITIKDTTNIEQIKELAKLFKELFPENEIIIIPECVTQLDILSSH